MYVSDIILSIGVLGYSPHLCIGSVNLNGIEFLGVIKKCNKSLKLRKQG